MGISLFCLSKISIFIFGSHVRLYIVKNVLKWILLDFCRISQAEQKNSQLYKTRDAGAELFSSF